MKVAALVLAFTALAGCAGTYHPPAGQATATLSFDMNSDSTETTGKFYRLFAYEDLACTPAKQGTKIDAKLFGDSREKLGPVTVGADMPMTFAVAYSESRFVQNRDCSFTASFTPVAGQSYTVEFASVRQALACGIRITDGSGAVVPFQSPDTTCAESMLGKRLKNGGAGIVNWQFRFSP